MMKLAVLACVVLVINYCDKVVSSDNSDQMDKISEFCRIQEKATDIDMANWKKDIKPKTRTLNCLDACVGEQMGFMTNNRLNVDAIMKIVAAETTDPKMIVDFKAIVEECKSVTAKDRCESSGKILDCISDGTRKRGMKEIL